MEIQELRNLYLNKIIKHINKINSELSLYNQSSEQYGGSSLTSLNYELSPPQLRFTQHNKSAVDSLLILKTKIEQLKISEERLNKEKLELEGLNKELNDRLINLNSSNVATAELSFVENQRMLEEIRLKENRISELQKTNSELTARIGLLSDKNNKVEEKNTELNRELEKAKKMSEKVQELNSNIEKISKESITSLFTRSKELIEFYYHSSIDVRDKTLELIKEIRQLDKEPKQPTIPNLEQIYTDYIRASYNASFDIETKYNISTFDEDLNKLKVLLNTKISQAKEINNELHLQYEKYLTEKDTILAKLTQSL